MCFTKFYISFIIFDFYPKIFKLKKIIFKFQIFYILLIFKSHNAFSFLNTKINYLQNIYNLFNFEFFLSKFRYLKKLYLVKLNLIEFTYINIKRSYKKMS